MGHKCVPHFYSVGEEGLGKSLSACSELPENYDRFVGEGVFGRWKLICQIIRDKSIDYFEEHDNSVR